MKGGCPVCVHSQRLAIEAAIRAGEPLRDVAARYGLRVRQLQAHRNCPGPRDAAV